MSIRTACSRRGSALPLAVGTLAVVASIIAISTTQAITSHGQQQRQIQSQNALAAVDAVLSRREARLRALAQHGNADEFAAWKNFDFDYTGDGTAVGTETQKNYGEDVVGDFRVRWKIEPMIVESPDQTGSGNVKKFITNPPPSTQTTALPGTGSTTDAWQVNDTKFLYRLAAEAVLYRDPDDPRLSTAASPSDGNDILARAQGVRFVSAANIPLFRYVIFYAQRGPKGDLELTHGGTLNVKGNVHSNGAIYLGGDTKAMSWAALSASSATNLGPTLGSDGVDQSTGSMVGGDDQPIRVYGVDGLFNLSKAAMYGGFSFAKYMTPLTSANLGWTPVTGYSTSATSPADSRPFPLDSSENYLPPSSPFYGTYYGTVINPYRVLDGSGLITTDSNRKINKVTITGSYGSNASSANDARDAFRQSSGGKKWSTASSEDFANLARTAETGGREVALDKSLLGRPLEPQQLAYQNMRHTNDGVADLLDESQLEEYARPVFRDNLAAGETPLTTTASLKEAAGYYLAKAMGAGDNDASASSIRYDGTTVTNETGVIPAAMTGWRLDAGASPGDKVGLVIRERYRPDFSIWGPGTGARVVPANHPEFKPYAYGKHYRPVNMDGFVPVNFGVGNWNSTGTGGVLNHCVSMTPTWTDLTYGSGTLTVKASTAFGNTSSLSSTYTDTCFTSNPRKMVHIGTEAVKVKDFSSVVVRIGSVSGPTSQQVGLMIAPGAFNSGIPQATRLTAAVTSSATTLTLDSLANVVKGTMLVVNNGEVVRVRLVGPLATPVVLTASQVLVERGMFGTSAAAAAAGAPINFPSDLPVACRLTADVTATSTTAFTVDDVSKLSVNDTLRLVNDVVRITAINATTKVITVTRAAADSGTTGSVTYPIYAGTPLHWGERSPYVAMLYSPGRGFFIQRRERPAQVVVPTASSWWCGNGTDGVAGSSAGTFATQTTNTADTTPTYTTGGKASVTQVLSQNVDGVQSSGPSTTYPDVSGSIVWTVESTTFSVNQYGRKRQDKTEYRRLSAWWNGQVVLTTATLPVNLAFWDPTSGTSGDVGDRGKTLSLFTAASSTAAAVAGNISSLDMQYTPAAMNLYQRAFLTGGTTYNPAAVPVASPALGANEIRYNGATPAASSVVWASQTDGTFNNTPGGDISVWSAISGITLPYVIPSGTYAGRRLVLATAATLNPTDPGTNPVWNPVGGAAPALPASPYSAITGSTVTTPLTATGIGFSVPRSAVTVDINPFVTRSGNFGFGATPAPVPMNLPITTWSPAPNTWSFRPDVWHEPITGAVGSAAIPDGTITAYGIAPATTSPLSGVWGSTSSMNDDIRPSGFATNAETWVAMARVDASGNVSTNPADQNVNFYYYTGPTPPASFPGSYTKVRDPAGNPVNVNLANLVLATPAASLATDQSPLLIGPMVASGSLGSPSTAGFTDYTLTRTDGSTLTFDSSSGNMADQYTRYLRSQYQVWWGTKEITDDFFAWNQGNDANRLAKEDWFYQPREFWSQSRWWNEDIQPPTIRGSAGADLVDTASYPYPVTYPAGSEAKCLLIERDDTGNPGSGSTDNPNNRVATTNRQLFAKTTVLTLNLRQIQDYLKTRALRDATMDPTDSAATPLAASFSGLIYASRTNRAPFVPDLNRFLPTPLPAGWPGAGLFGRGQVYDQANHCWLSSCFEYGKGTTSGAPVANGYSSAPDNYDNFTTNPPYDPWTRGPQVYQGVQQSPGTIDNPALAGIDLGALGAAAAVTDPEAANLVPAAGAYTGMITPRFRPSEFHHGVRLVNGASLDWNYAPAPAVPDFGSCKLSVATPNQLYIQGNFNSTARSVRMKDGSIKSRYTPVAVMGDVITLLSNSFKDTVYQNPGLGVDSRKVISGGILATPNGAPASTTTYNTCILTHNTPTSKATSRFGEASSFVNTMQYIENWNGQTMNFTGSLVVMNTRRYTNGFLLEQPKVSGRTPFGWAGWNARSDSGGTTPRITNLAADAAAYRTTFGALFASGTGYLDWCCTSTTTKTANTSVELLPFDYPAGLAGGKTVANTNDGVPPVYFQPNRNMTFNDDLLTEEGTPPFTPFGNEVRGLGAWSRIVQ